LVASLQLIRVETVSPFLPIFAHFINPICMKAIISGILFLSFAIIPFSNASSDIEIQILEFFDNNAAPADWKYEAGNPPTGEWLAPGANGKGHCITASNGAWGGPMIQLEPYEYYRLSFKGKSSGKCYWFLNFYTPDGKEYPVDHYNCFEASADWEPKEYYFRCIANESKARLFFRPMNDKPAFIDDVVIQKANRKTVAEWADRVYAAMPPVKYQAPADRWQLIPKTMAALRGGKTLKVVMLGDSIVNDTGNSAYDVRIERMYPGARWNIVQSIRGSTGCKAYKEGNWVKEMVLDHQPDLLMIGGISNGDAESVRTVIRQVRAKMPDLEIFVMSGPIGRVDPFKYPDWKTEPQPGEYRTQLRTVAADEKCEFLDMETLWGNYVKTAGKDWDYFTRDELHGNSEGRQVLSKLLETYFAPKVP